MVRKISSPPLTDINLKPILDDDISITHFSASSRRGAIYPDNEADISETPFNVRYEPSPNHHVLREPLQSQVCFGMVCASTTGGVSLSAVFHQTSSHKPVLDR